MPISQAYRPCPYVAFVPVNMKLYAGVSVNVREKGLKSINRHETSEENTNDLIIKEDFGNACLGVHSFLMKHCFLFKQWP